MMRETYKGKRILITGHTGFKGSWLCTWLIQLGAEVYGYALDPPTRPSLFDVLKLRNYVHDYRGDIRDAKQVEDCVETAKPDIIFHLAAQPIVRQSYEKPIETYETNVIGTANVLETARSRRSRCAVVVVTTDKVYKNQEWEYGYREIDLLGGHDPYSASKACAELIVHSYYSSYFKEAGHLSLATARAGNVMGGGDWAVDRLVPDCFRAMAKGQSVVIRNPKSIRPWQHVLDPLSGYLELGARLWNETAPTRSSVKNVCGQAFNFGPAAESNKTVREVLQELGRSVELKWEEQEPIQPLHEAGILQLSIDKARKTLGWWPVIDFELAIKMTVEWYKNYYHPTDTTGPQYSLELTKRQIAFYEESLQAHETKLSV